MSDIRLGLAAWHYPHRSLTENIKFFTENGFNAYSAIGGDFYRACSDETESEALAKALDVKKPAFTVHFKIPDPDNAEETAKFDDAIPKMRAWQEKYGMLDILSFDVWGDRQRCVPKIIETAEYFRGAGTVIACEDIPLDASEAEWYGDYQPDRDKFGLLIDVGHMNLRLSKAGDNSGEAFRAAFEKKPFPIFELHLHNNNGLKDEHELLWNGTIDYRAIIRLLKERGYDGIFTIESVPAWHGFTGSDADAEILKCRGWWLDLWNNTVN